MKSIMKTLTALKREKDSLEKQIVRRTKEGKRIRARIARCQKEISRLEGKLEKLLGTIATGALKKITGKIPKKRQRRIKPGRKPVTKRGQKKRLTRREMVVEVLSKAKKPLNLDEIVKGLIAKGYPVKSKNPKRLLSVTVYTGKTFKKVKPGYFTVRK